MGHIIRTEGEKPGGKDLKRQTPNESFREKTSLSAIILAVIERRGGTAVNIEVRRV